MKSAPCTRAWQAQAIEDGRLAADEAAAFARHAASCASCAHEREMLAALRAELSRLPELGSTPLERRRQRNELLRRADALVIGPTGARWTLALACALTCLGVALGLALWPPTQTPQRAAAPAAPTFRIVASQDATWRTLEQSATLRLIAEKGQLEIAVDKLVAGQRFVLALPDGELEVKGTRFVVDITGAETRRVQVSEGRVALRMRGQAERMLSAGQAWEAPPHTAGPAPTGPGETAAAAPARVEAHAAHRPSAAGEPGHKPDAGRAAAQAGALAPKLPEAGPEPALAEPGAEAAGPRFAAAMTAFSLGDYARADALFARFEQDHPSDARVEDALFLRAVAHARRGDAAASRAMAQAYLLRYPQGLRRPEATRMAEAP